MFPGDDCMAIGGHFGRSSNFLVLNTWPPAPKYALGGGCDSGDIVDDDDDEIIVHSCN